jgi:hypothetical protein
MGPYAPGGIKLFMKLWLYDGQMALDEALPRVTSRGQV